MASEPVEPAELEQIFTAQHDRVYRTAYRITGNSGDAEDVLQTVFLRLARQGWASIGVTNVEAYLHRAAVNAALDLVRMRRDALSVPAEDAVSRLVDDPRRQPERSQQSRELRELVRRAVSRLSPRAAEIFALRYFEEYDNKEIAAMLGVSQTDVAVSLHRSRARLQEDIRSYLGERS
jgi:RNA polymerase sigma-70 factor (ECF subfamily)